MKTVLKLLILSTIIISCKATSDKLFDIKLLRNHLKSNFNINLDNSINTAHNLSAFEIKRLEEDIEISSNFSIMDSLFYKDLQAQISNSEIKIEDASKYLSESFNKLRLQQFNENGELTIIDYNDINNYINFIEKEFSNQQFYNARMTFINIHYMKSKGVLTELEYRELIMVNHLLFIIDIENG